LDASWRTGACAHRLST